MKRFTAIVLLLSMALFAFPVFIPASAAETSGNYFNVLDYTGYDDGLSNTFDVEGSTTISYNLSTYLGSFPVYGVELTYSYVGVQPSISSFQLNHTPFSVTSSPVGSGLVRVRADLSGSVGSSFTLTFNASVTTVTIHSFNVYTVGATDAPISGTMYAGGYSHSFDGSTETTFNPGNATELLIRTDWWRNYDYMDLYLNAYFIGINSISVYLLETDTGTEYIVPFDLNNLYSFVDDSDVTWHDVQLHIDLTGFDHNEIGDAILCVQLYFDSTVSTRNSFTLYSFRGFVFSDPIDADMKWHQVLFNNLSNWLLNIYSAIGNLDQSITNSFDFWFQQLQSWFNSIRTQIINSFKSLDTKITTLFDTWFTSLDGWLFEQTEAITSKLDELFGGEKFTDEEKQELVSDLESIGDSVSCIGQSSQELESMVKENYFLDIDVQEYSNLVKFMDLLWSQSYIFMLVVFTFFFALVGYVLFGKR